MLKTAFLISAALILLYSCEKTCYCESNTMTLKFISYTDDEVDTIEMRRYIKGTAFSSPIDTILITDSANTFSRSADTVTIVAGAERYRFRSTFDYTLFLPSLGRTIRIDSIFEIQDAIEGGKDLQCNCLNRIPYYDLNDSTMRTDSISPSILIKRI
jgi:hypothetical protein